MPFSNVVGFIKELYHSEKVGLHEPRFTGNEKKYVNECIDTSFVSSVGKFVDQFEIKCTEFTGAKYAVATVNGTAALYIALKVAGVLADEEVLTQPLTFIATANTIAYCGAIPVFLDVDKSTLGLSADALSEFLEKHTIQKQDGYTYNKDTGRKISACIPMHTFGHPVMIDVIKDLCNKYNITLIEDAAESIGSKYKGKHTGTFGKIGILSFNGNKIITTGGGGMIITDDEKLARLSKHITTQAKIPHPYEYIHDMIGYNFRLPNLNAAMGVAQMENLDFFIQKKRELAKIYAGFFSNTEFDFFTEPDGCFSNYWLNVVLMKNREERDEFLKFTNNNGVMTRPAWRLMNKLDTFKNCPAYNLNNSEWLEDRVVNIPSSVVL
jgi:perosamine synthetase